MNFFLVQTIIFSLQLIQKLKQSGWNLHFKFNCGDNDAVVSTAIRFSYYQFFLKKFEFFSPFVFG